MSKSVLQTINEYVQDVEARERLATADLELELCDRMVHLREQAGLTQQQLAAKMGFSQAYIAKLENGAYEACGIGTLRLFARALGHDIAIDTFLMPTALLSRARRFGDYCARAQQSLRDFANSVGSTVIDTNSASVAAAESAADGANRRLVA